MVHRNTDHKLKETTTRFQVHVLNQDLDRENTGRSWWLMTRGPIIMWSGGDYSDLYYASSLWLTIYDVVAKGYFELPG